MHTGECTCKRLVTGKDCNQCLPETFGLSDSHDGCAFCNCDPGGSLDNHCDIETGQCRCRSHMTGRTCSIPKQNHFIPSLHTVIEAENSECESDASHNNCSLVIPPQDRPPYWTGPGFMRTYEGSQITITVPYVPKTMEYDVVVRYQSQSSNDWEDASIIILKPNDFDPEGPCGESEESYGEKIHFRLPDREMSTVAVRNVCFEEGKPYKFKITFRRQSFEEDNPVAQILIDSVSSFDVVFVLKEILFLIFFRSLLYHVLKLHQFSLDHMLLRIVTGNIKTMVAITLIMKFVVKKIFQGNVKS